MLERGVLLTWAEVAQPVSNVRGTESKLHTEFSPYRCSDHTLSFLGFSKRHGRHFLIERPFACAKLAVKPERCGLFDSAPRLVRIVLT